jgi:hypothetical protein
MSDLAKVLAELQSVRTELIQGQDELRRGQDELRRGQLEVRDMIADEVAGLVQNLSLLGEEMHRDFQKWSQDKGGVIEKVKNQVGAQMQDLRRQISQIRSCGW